MTDFNQKTHDTDVGSHGGQSRQMMEVFENQEFGSIRLLQEAGKTFFCASDVAKALGYVNPYAAVKRHCRGPLTKREGVVQKVNQYGDAGEQVVEISFITEGDVYRLIVHSKLPSAERFEHWVFDEVLPSIRKHGVYMSDSILDQVIQHPEVIYTLAQELVAEREQLEGIRKQLDGGKCILQLRGVRPFKSDKYDLTQHPNYKLTAGADKKNTFSIEAFLDHRLKLKPGDKYEVVDADHAK